MLAADPRGIGRSTKSPPPYTVEAWADDFAVMIDKLGFGPIHVLGSSLGGSMALALAQRHPGKLKSLILVGGFSELDRATELNFRLRLRLIEKLGMSDEVADYMGLWTLTRKFINSDAGFATMRANQANIRANSAQSYNASRRRCSNKGRCQPGQEREPKFTALLDSIKTPTLVVTSDNDHLIPKELERSDRRPHCRRETRRHAGCRPHSLHGAAGGSGAHRAPISRGTGRLMFLPEAG